MKSPGNAPYFFLSFFLLLLFAVLLLQGARGDNTFLLLPRAYDALRAARLL